MCRTTQDENLKRICDFHNAQGTHDLDVSVHFNASNGQGHGTEVFYTSSAGHEYADAICDAICEASGLTNRGAKNDDSIGGLYFLSHTNEVAVLIEVCFGDNETDCTTYYDEFDNICEAIGDAICTGERRRHRAARSGPSRLTTMCCSPRAGRARPLAAQTTWASAHRKGLPSSTITTRRPTCSCRSNRPAPAGLARRLSPDVFYLACRWDYDVTSKLMLRDSGYMALVTAKKTGISRLAHPADWGPHEEQTGRAADLSPALLKALVWIRMTK